MEKDFYIYILANKPYGTLYIGITSNLIKRIWEHRNNVVAGFTREYHVHSLVYYQQHPTAESAILREKTLKNWHRRWKISLIEEENPAWRDLYDEILGVGEVSPVSSSHHLITK